MSTLSSQIKSLAGTVGLFMSRRADRKLLLKLDDRTLADINISRELLESGVKAWPWHLPKDEEVSMAARGIRAAIQELGAYSDAELADLGISRGSIPEAVLHGRPGIDTPLNDNGLAEAAA